MSSKRKPTDPLTERVRVMEEENMNEESPKHGPTLSTSTSSVGGIKTYDPKLEIAAKSFFTKAEDYITNELDTINIDFRTLTDMNNLMQNNYAQVQPNVEQLKKYSIDIAHKYNEMWPLLQQIKTVAEMVDNLENMAQQMDKYTILLEERILSTLSTDKRS